MTKDSPSENGTAKKQPAQPISKNEIEELREKIRELEETLEAIRSGEVDAIVVAKGDARQVYTLEGADHPYRGLVENIREGALTISRTGMILYTNTRFAEMVKMPPDKVLGTSLIDHVCPEHRAEMEEALARDHEASMPEQAPDPAGREGLAPGPHLHEPARPRRRHEDQRRRHRPEKGRGPDPAAGTDARLRSGMRSSRPTSRTRSSTGTMPRHGPTAGHRKRRLGRDLVEVATPGSRRRRHGRSRRGSRRARPGPANTS